MYGETFYGRHTAQHQLQRRRIKIKKMSSIKNIDKKEDGLYGDTLCISDWLSIL